MTLKHRINKLEGDNTAKNPPVFVWGDDPVPADLKPGQEVVRLRWKGDKEARDGQEPA